jgi:peroxiredoxin
MMLRTYGLRAGDFSERRARLLAVSPQTPDNSLSMAEKHSLEFPVLSAESGWTLPAPAAFVIHREGIIRFAGVNGDYTQRVETEEALAAVDWLAR